MIKVVCWNIERNKRKSWEALRKMDADVALLQEAGKPPPDVELGDQKPWEPWEKRTGWPFGAAVAKLSKRIKVKWFRRVFPITEPGPCELPVSGVGTIAAARVRKQERDSDLEPFIAVSMSTEWLTPHPSTKSKWKVGYSDASAHRIVSDLSTFIGHKDPSTHRILAAGDLNIIYGATDDNRLALAARDRTVFERMDALGLEFLGPQSEDTGNVQTFRAGTQLDYVFASRGFHKSVTVRAMNDEEEWGPSDHCRLLIEVRADPAG